MESPDVNNYIRNSILKFTCVAAVLCCAAAASVRAQDAMAVAPNNGQPPQDAAAALASLPEADILVYLNPRRILNEAAPRVLPQKDLDNLQRGFAEMKTKAGIDPAAIDHVVLQVRFKKPADDLSFSLPEFMLVATGDFDGAAVLQLAREAAKGKLREETYGSKTLNVFPIDDVARQAEKTPILKSLSEIAIALVKGDTIVVGTTNYVKAAIDAAEGKNRINAELLNSALRDPGALISTAGSPWTAFAKTFALLGTQSHPRPPKCDTKLGDFYGAITMDAQSFKIRGAMNADNPDTAKIIKSLLSMTLQSAMSTIKDSQAKDALNRLVITPTETEVLIQADVSQQAIADFIRDSGMPKKDEAGVTSPVPESKPKPHRRPSRRRRPKN
jgi:hypothetical protein